MANETQLDTRELQAHIDQLLAENDRLRNQLVLAGQVLEKRDAAEDAFRRIETRHRALLESIPDIVFRIRRDGVFLDFRANRNELAVPPERILNRSILDCMPGDFARMIMDKVQQTLIAGSMQTLEYKLPTIVRPDEPRDYEARLVASGFDEVTVIVRDVTDRKRAEEELQRAHNLLEIRVAERTAELTRANELLTAEIAERKQAESQMRELQAQLAHVNRLSHMGELASALAHEINQPLAIIANYARACERGLQNETVDGAEVQESLSIIGDQALRGGEILQRLRKLVSKSTVEPSIVNATALVEEVIALVQPESKRRGIDVQFRSDDSEVLVNVDPIQIQQVVVNLVQNAFDAMSSDSSVNHQLDIHLSVFQGTMTLSIRDTGAAPDGDTIDSLFEPYVTTKDDGLGMGLSICRTIVTTHGGRIWATINSDRGTTFHFTLSTSSGAQSHAA